MSLISIIFEFRDRSANGFANELFTVKKHESYSNMYPEAKLQTERHE